METTWECGAYRYQARDGQEMLPMLPLKANKTGNNLGGHIVERTPEFYRWFRGPISGRDVSLSGSYVPRTTRLILEPGIHVNTARNVPPGDVKDAIYSAKTRCQWNKKKNKKNKKIDQFNLRKSHRCYLSSAGHVELSIRENVRTKSANLRCHWFSVLIQLDQLHSIRSN